MARILVIDDEQLIRSLLEETLETEGYEVDTAGDGKEGVDKIFDPNIEAYDMIITDLIMPGKEGIETICKIKKTCPHLKIIAMSGGGRIGPEDYLKLAKTIGANGTLKKPFSHENLLKMIKDLLE